MLLFQEKNQFAFQTKIYSKLKKIIIPVLIMLFPSFFSNAHSQQPPDSQLPIALPKTNATVHTLDNGLTVILDSDPSAPVVSLQGWVATGSIHEGDWLGAGLSHILEHMLFKGTQKRKAGEIARQVQDLGGYINAYTTFDRTVYYINVPAAGASAALEILGDVLMNATLPEEEYAKEQEVIRREFAMGMDDPNRQGIQLLLRTLYPKSPLGIPVIGYLDIFNKLTREDVLNYYKQRYVPNNITLVVSGDFDSSAILKQIREMFANYPRKKLPPVLVPTEPPQLGRRDAHEEFATELSRLYLAWRVPALDHPDAPALEVLAILLGNGRSSILNRILREQKQLVHSISAGVYSTHDESVFYIFALCDPEKRQAAETEIILILENLEKNLISDKELDKARRIALTDLLNSLVTAEGRAASHGANWFLTRNLNFGRELLEAFGKVQPGDLSRSIRDYLRKDRLCVASLNPKGSLQDGSKQQAKREVAPIEKTVLANGLTVLVREDFRLPLVNLAAVFRGGTLAETPQNNGITHLYSQTLLKGTANRTAEQIAEEIEGAGGSISSGASNDAFSVSIEVLRDELPLAFEILADILSSPTFPENEIATERASQLAAIKAEDDQITAVARNLLRSNLYGEHPYSLRPLGSVESVSQLSREQLLEFHRQFAVARNCVLSVFGDVRKEEVLELAEKYLSGLPSGEKAFERPARPENLAAAKAVIHHMDKEQAVILVGYLGADILSADRPALELIASASSDLGSRFFDRIREKMGLAYFVGASQRNGAAPGSFVFYVGTDPAKVESVSAALENEIHQLASDGLTEEELNRAKRKILGAEAFARQSNAAFALDSAGNEIFGLGANHYLQREKEIESVTMEQVRAVAQKYFLQQPAVKVVVLPMEGRVSRMKSAQEQRVGFIGEN